MRFSAGAGLLGAGHQLTAITLRLQHTGRVSALTEQEQDGRDQRATFAKQCNMENLEGHLHIGTDHDQHIGHQQKAQNERSQAQ